MSETVNAEDRALLDELARVAGIADGIMLVDVTMEQYDRMMDVDLRGVFLGLKHGIRTMLECGNGGAVVNWSSIGGLNSSIATSVYGAAKAGVVSLTKTAALEYAAQGIRVNCIAPGPIQTPAIAELAKDPAWLARQKARLLLDDLGKPEDIAYAALYLASDESAFVTGLTLVVDGGATSH